MKLTTRYTPVVPVKPKLETITLELQLDEARIIYALIAESTGVSVDEAIAKQRYSLEDTASDHALRMYRKFQPVISDL